MRPCVRSKPAVVAAVVAALVLAACSGGGDTSPSETPLGQDGTVVQGSDPDRAGPAAPIEGAVPGGTVTVLGGIALSPEDLDPTSSYFPAPISILSGLVTRSLTQYVYDPDQESMVLVPDLATDLGTPNADFTQWSFTIRDGVRFEDGTEVTAGDVAFGIKRSFDRKAFPGGATYSNDYFLDGDSYQGPYRSGTSYSGVVVEGDTLTLKMARPFPDMPYWASFPAMSPIPEQGSNPATYGLHPVATGPYKFAEFAPGKSLTLVRNDEWDPDTDPGRHAYPDRYEFDFSVPFKRIDVATLGHSEAGETTLSYENVSAGHYQVAQELDRLAVGPSPCTTTLFPDYRQIDEIRVREAIGSAFPYEDVSTVWGDILDVRSLPGASILPPGFPGRQDYNVLETEPGTTDPDKARQLLKEAGYSPGEYELRFLYVTSDPFSVELKDQYVKSLEAAGFKATPFPTATDEEAAAVFGDPNAPINVRVTGWCSDWQSGSSWFPFLFHSEGLSNYSYFAEPAVDAEIERIGLLPFDEQQAAWGALDRSIMTNYYPAIITRYRADALPHGSRIGGMNHDAVFGAPTWKDIHVVP